MHSRLTRPPLVLGALVAALSLLAGCDEEKKYEILQPPDEVLPDDPDPEYGPGNWAVSQRGVALDQDDPGVINTDDTHAGISADRVRSEFGLLVINRLYVDWTATECAPDDEADHVLPRPTAEAVIRCLAGTPAPGDPDVQSCPTGDTTLQFDRVAVNVDLLTPSRLGLLYQCFSRGSPEPRFGEPQHREAIIAALEDLADLPNLAYITVGMEMDRYYHVRSEDGQDFRDDYSNWVTLYREIYRRLKAKRGDLKVGPGISWAAFRRRTVPDIAAELSLGTDEELKAVELARQRTIQPLLKDPDGNATADFLAISMIPFTSEEPFLGEPIPTGADGEPSEEGREAVHRYYRYVNLVADGLPVVLPQIDWPVPSSQVANKKGPYLEILKESLSPVNIEWAAWRRLADIPTRETAGITPCAKYTSRRNGMAFPKDYCTAGMINPSGRVRDVLGIFTSAP